jgi:hypothetical protein
VSADVLRERWKSDDERKARVVRLIVRGKAGHAQALIEAAVREEQQPCPKRFVREVGRA